jgi:hypothetical protein
MPRNNFAFFCILELFVFVIDFLAKYTRESMRMPKICELSCTNRLPHHSKAEVCPNMIYIYRVIYSTADPTRLLPGLSGEDMIFQWIGMVEYIPCYCAGASRTLGVSYPKRRKED